MVSLPQWPVAAGWPGAVATFGLCAAAVLALVVTPRWAAEADALRAARTAAPRPAPQAAPAPLLPQAGDANTRTASLLEAAIRHGVTVPRSTQRQDGSPLPRLRLSMSVQGDYADLRRFIGEALAADPALALERLQLRRADPAAPRLDAELQWVLLLPPEAAR